MEKGKGKGKAEQKGGKNNLKNTKGANNKKELERPIMVAKTTVYSAWNRLAAPSPALPHVVRGAGDDKAKDLAQDDRGVGQAAITALEAGLPWRSGCSA